jgi:15-cis-phytoene synthase
MIDLDPDRRLILAYTPARDRPALAALWRLDVTLATILATGRDPTVSRIRLAWWREALERLDRQPPPPEPPVLAAIAAALLPRGLDGAALMALEDGWTRLLTPGPLTADDLDGYARERGGALFALSARILGGAADGVERAGQLWALADLARHSRDPAEAARALAAAAALPAPERWPPALRPLAMLAMLARRDVARGLGRLERPGAPPRMLRLLGYRLFGH